MSDNFFAGLTESGTYTVQEVQGPDRYKPRTVPHKEAEMVPSAHFRREKRAGPISSAVLGEYNIVHC